LGKGSGVVDGIAKRCLLGSTKALLGVSGHSNTVVDSRNLNKLRKRGWRRRCFDWKDDPVLAPRAVVLGIKLQVLITASSSGRQILQAPRFTGVCTNGIGVFLPFHGRKSPGIALLGLNANFTRHRLEASVCLFRHNVALAAANKS
jgi:hypothetical protein